MPPLIRRFAPPSPARGEGTQCPATRSVPPLPLRERVPEGRVRGCARNRVVVYPCGFAAA